MHNGSLHIRYSNQAQSPFYGRALFLKMSNPSINWRHRARNLCDIIEFHDAMLGWIDLIDGLDCGNIFTQAFTAAYDRKGRIFCEAEMIVDACST